MLVGWDTQDLQQCSFSNWWSERLGKDHQGFRRFLSKVQSMRLIVGMFSTGLSPTAIGRITRVLYTEERGGWICWICYVYNTLIIRPIAVGASLVFNIRKQGEGELFAEFLTDLTCLDSIVRDRIVSGISDGATRKKLLIISDLTLETRESYGIG